MSGLRLRRTGGLKNPDCSAEIRMYGHPSWSVVFGSRHSCLVSGSVMVSCWGSYTYVPGFFLLWERAVSSSLGQCTPLSVCFRCLSCLSCFV